MARPSRFSPEVRERAVRMVVEHAQDHLSQGAAITSIAEKVDRREDRVRGRDAPSLGAAGRAGQWPAARPDDG
jgi:transposase-like protein